MILVNFIILLSVIFKVQGLIPIWTNTSFPPSKPIWSGPSIEFPYEETFQDNYDFIVIGSGPTGSVIANRLTENPAWRVLLLEAGKVQTILTEIPVITNYFQGTDYNWGYLVEKQDNMCLGFVDQRMHWPSGKVLGGSSVINGMIFVRGNRLDFDRWANNGNAGWSYEEVIPYFKKFENYMVKIQDKDYHQTGGPLNVEDVAFRSEGAKVFTEAMQEFGYKYIDPNGRQQIGVSYVHGITKFGRRRNAYNAFIEPILKRKNLKVLTQARVTKILINKDTKTAYGVTYVKNKRYHTALASKEVILSAGALNSPQLLMLSGIGPKDHLQELGIELVQNLPVGQKLYDHLGFYGLTVEVNDSITLPAPDISDLVNSLRVLQEYIHGKGILTSTTGIEALGFIRTNLSQDVSSYPDIEYILFGNALSADKGVVFRKSIGITDEIYNAILKPLEDKNAFSIIPMLYHPKSFGYIRLKSKNPFAWPKFFGNYLTDEQHLDVKTVIESIRFVQRLLTMPAYQKYDAKLVNIPLPGCEHHEYDSDIYWECALRHLGSTIHHHTTSCKMGPINDPEAVVNDQLFVHGIKMLRVADTSIIPEPITAHTSAVCYMIGEKISDAIKEHWSQV